jgi:CDP-diacylglycerol--glycerol-3-phosphate 3-phosphatidyltransferase
MGISVYELKSRFQDLLRPLVKRLATAGATANQVTIAAGVISVAIGIFVGMTPDHRWFLLIPVWFFVRMALNAIDGMLAREHDQKTVLGAYLNEICDVVSDAALYLPFAFVAPANLLPVMLVIFLSALTEYAGVLGQAVGGARRYDGPLGKSDRAVLFSALAAFVGFGGTLANWPLWFWGAVSLLLAWTVVNRIRAGIGAGR